jgi:lysophospholipase L1-like esterase
MLNHSAPPRHVQDPKHGPLPLPEGTTVLHVGDSFAGALGVPLNKLLRDAKVRSILKYRTASYIVDWAHREPLRDYLFQYKPDLVLVTLGANELEIEAPERRIPAIEKIVETIGDRPCIWVGIPLWEGATNGLPEIIEKHAAPCRYLDTDTLFPDMPRARDNIHPTMEARDDWASKVAHWLAQERRPTANRIWALSGP